MPMNATVQADNGTFSTLMAVDTTIHNSGSQSLKVLPGTSPSAYRMLSVPIPGPAFWVRLFVRSDVVFGGDGHNSIFQAMTDANHNSSTTTVEIAEQFCQIVLNQHDAIYPMGLSSCSTVGPVLAANTWHCVEAHFDGGSGNVQVYADKMKVIDATAWATAKANFTTFEFGFAQYHGPARTTWYDDVVVAPDRVGCP